MSNLESNGMDAATRRSKDGALHVAFVIAQASPAVHERAFHRLQGTFEEG
jgi:hypothetical protein